MTPAAAPVPRATRPQERLPDPPTAPGDPALTIDALGRKCPIPIIMLAERIREVPIGQRRRGARRRPGRADRRARLVHAEVAGVRRRDRPARARLVLPGPAQLLTGLAAVVARPGTGPRTAGRTPTTAGPPRLLAASAPARR